VLVFPPIMHEMSFLERQQADIYGPYDMVQQTYLSQSYTHMIQEKMGSAINSDYISLKHGIRKIDGSYIPGQTCLFFSYSWMNTERAILLFF